MPRSRKLKHNWLFLNGRIGEYDRTPMIIIIILSSLSIMGHFSIKEVIVGNLFARQFKTVFNESIDFEICCIAYKTCKIRMIMLEGTSFPNVQFVLLRRPHSPPAWSAQVIMMVPLSFQSGGVTQVANQIHCWKTSFQLRIYLGGLDTFKVLLRCPQGKMVLSLS